MNKVALVGAFVAVALLAAGATYLFFIVVGTTMPSIEHFTLAKAITIEDVDADYTFTLTCIWSGNQKVLYMLPGLSLNPGETYSRSDWVGRTGTDLEVVMTIWGPGDAGNDYQVEFGKVASNEILIELPDGQTHTFPRNSPEGYWLATVTM